MAGRHGNPRGLTDFGAVLRFGRPFILRKGISTAIIADRIDAGEAPAALADDYELPLDEIELAVLYERAA